MPDISLPEVRLKDKLPEGLRDMTMDDIQKAMPEVHLPKLELPRFDLSRDAQNAAREAEKATRRAGKAAAREAAKAAKAVEDSLPRRSGPNPVAIGFLFMLGGLVVGWLLASNPTTAPRISAWLDDLRTRFDQWRGTGSALDEEWDATQPGAYADSLGAPLASEPYGDTLSGSETGVGVGPGELPEGVGAGDPTSVGVSDTFRGIETPSTTDRY